MEPVGRPSNKYIRRYGELSEEHHEKSLDDFFHDTPIPGQAYVPSLRAHQGQQWLHSESF
jgi:hypothetical protein